MEYLQETITKTPGLNYFYLRFKWFIFKILFEFNYGRGTIGTKVRNLVPRRLKWT